MSVDANGAITAQGKTVEKVLVDGEEFFGDDPTLVTRNIRSDMVKARKCKSMRRSQKNQNGEEWMSGERIQTINVSVKRRCEKGRVRKGRRRGGIR